MSKELAEKLGAMRTPSSQLLDSDSDLEEAHENESRSESASLPASESTDLALPATKHPIWNFFKVIKI